MALTSRRKPRPNCCAFHICSETHAPTSRKAEPSRYVKSTPHVERKAARDADCVVASLMVPTMAAARKSAEPRR